MAEKTWDVEDPRDLPYRFSFSPNTGEVFLLGMGGMGMGIMGKFENLQAFHRFLVEGNKTDSLIADPIPDNVSDILGDK